MTKHYEIVCTYYLFQHLKTLIKQGQNDFQKWCYTGQFHHELLEYSTLRNTLYTDFDLAWIKST